jgi:mRNA interferase RelE/StbE
MSYRILIEKSVFKTLGRIQEKYRTKILSAIKNLESNPRPSNCKKLTGRDAWRIRVADYRIIYEVRDNDLMIYVITIGHRKDIYR